MSNLDLTIAEIMHGDTQVLKIMKGDSKVWPSGDIAIVLVQVENATCSIGTSRVALHSALSATVSAETGYVITSVHITMGGINIASSAYNRGEITINDVTDDVVITAVAEMATQVITFEDSAVKTICVTNWGGGVVSGEITIGEAAAVTSLDHKFYKNSSIQKFNELRYFVGLSSLYYTTVNSTPAGQFYQCSGLKEVTLPIARFTNLRGAFRECTALESIDLSPVTGSPTMEYAFYSNRSMTEAILPGLKYGTGTWNYVFRATYANTTYAKLTTVHVDGIADFSNVTFNNTTFINQAYLTTITGGWTNIKSNIDFASCSRLTRESILVVINGLYDYIGAEESTRQTLTLHATAKARLTADDIALAEAKGWNVA